MGAKVASELLSQRALIRRVLAVTGASLSELAAHCAISPETLRKYLAPYQRAGTPALRLIELFPLVWQAGAAIPAGSPVPADPPLADLLAAIIERGTPDQIEVAAQLLQTLFRQIPLAAPGADHAG